MKRNIFEVSAPIGGLNAISDLVSMPPQDALVLENFNIEPYGVKVRRGFEAFATGFTAVPSEIFEYDSGAAQEIFTAVDNNIYQITASSKTSVVASLTSDAWSFVNFGTAAGRFLVGVNGADTGRTYNGTTWSNISVTGASSADMKQVLQYKNRLFFVEKDALSVWSLPVRSIGGALTEFPMSSFFRRGGKLAAAFTVSMQDTDGMDDFIAFMSDRGEILLYAGTDPSSDFVLQGRFETAPPIGERFFADFGGDALLLTREGVVAMSDVFAYGRVPPERNLSAKINPLLTDDYEVFGALAGWRLSYAPEEQTLYIAVPVGGGASKIYVMNTLLRAWSCYAGVPGNALASLSDGVYAADTGRVCKIETGSSDNGSAISSEFITGYSALGAPGRKYVFGVKPNINARSLSGAEASLDVLTDYQDTVLKKRIYDAAASEAAIAEWDVSDWDAADWEPTERIYNQETTVGKFGEVFAAKMRVRGIGSNLRVQKMTYYYERSADL